MILTDSKIYIDTALFIYYLEKSNMCFNSARKFFIDCKKREAELFTSAVTIEEYCVYPLSNGNKQAVKNFQSFLNGMNIRKVSVDENIALKAAEIRAKYPAFKALDSIHLATALLSDCTTFVTNDKQLRQIKEIHVCTMEMLENE